VPIDVVGDAPFSNVELRIFPSVGYPKTIAHASFSNTTPLAIGIYLPEKASGKVQLMAEANDGRCVVGRGTATASDVQAGVLSPTVTLPIAHVTGCDAPTGGTGQGGATGAGGAGGGGAGGAGGGTIGALTLRNLDARAGGADETGQPWESWQRSGSLVAAR
jgi:hypothetical protein